MNRLRSLFRNLTQRRERDALLREELASCAEILADEKRRSGISEEESRRQALLEIGGIEQGRLQVREATMGATLEILVQDIRYGWRSLLNAKAWTAIIVLSLALGIGANTLTFSLVNGLLMRTIPVTHSERLVRFRWSGPTDLTGFSDTVFSNSSTGYPIHALFSRVVFDRLREDRQTLSDLVASQPQQAIVFYNGESQWADGLIASGNYYQALGVQPTLGRTFTPEDDKPNAELVVVLSYHYWASRFFSDPNIVGKKILANDLPATIIGVTPKSFIGIQGLAEKDKDLTFPLAHYTAINHANPAMQRLRDSTWNLTLMGRLQGGIRLTQVQAAMNGVFQSAAQMSWETRLSGVSPAQRAQLNQQAASVRRPPTLVVQSGSRGLLDPDAQTIRAGTILTIVVALLLVIVCANVANLTLSRSTARRSEISVRLSMGATRARLIRQLLTESLLLALSGAVLGLAINHWGRLLLPAFRSAQVSDDQQVLDLAALPALDWRILAFVIVLTLITGIVFGLVPALRATRLNLATALKDNSRSLVGTRSMLGRTLLIAQVGISVTLLVGAGLFLQTVRNLRNVAVGFNPDQVLTFHVSLRAVAPDAPDRFTSLEQIQERVGRLPGVQSIAGTTIAFWQTQVVGSRPFFRAGSAEPVMSEILAVSPGFFATMQIPMLSGRDFNRADNPNPPVTVVIINELAAERFFPGQDPIGQSLSGRANGGNVVHVIGVVGNTKYGDVRAPAQPTLYLPALGSTTWVLRAAGDPMKLAPSIEKIVREVDPKIPVAGLATEDDLGDSRIQSERLFAGFYVLFGGLALLLASMGLFGLMSYSVARRTNEIGMRMALGARRQDVVRMVMRESMTLVGMGAMAGVILAVAANRLIASQLYGLAANDISTIILAVAVMLVVGSLAAYLPARRASKVDPLLALRHG